jgi:heme-degrading monooxygenase HmoA
MIVVIFEVELLAKKVDRYFELANELRKHLIKIEGFISIERFQSLTSEYKFISLSYWRDRKAIDTWYNKSDHTAAQSEGRLDIFKDYRICVADVFRDYDQSTGRPTFTNFKHEDS